MTNKKSILFKVSAVLLIIAAISASIIYAICMNLASQDNISEKYTLKEKNDGFLLNILKGAAFGKEFEVSESELNTYINEKYCTEFSPKNSGIENIMLYFHKDLLSEIYSKIYYKGKEYAVRAEVAFDINSETSIVRVTFYNAYIGELKISERKLSDILSHIFEKSEIVSVDNTTLYVKAKYTYELPKISLDIYLIKFEASDGAICCRTNSLTGEALMAAGEYIMSPEGQAAVSGIYNNIKEKIHSIFHN